MTGQTLTTPAAQLGEFCRRPDAARFLSISIPLLRKLEREGKGPKRVRIGRAVIYNRQSLREWAAAREQ